MSFDHQDETWLSLQRKRNKQKNRYFPVLIHGYEKTPHHWRVDPVAKWTDSECSKEPLTLLPTNVAEGQDAELKTGRFNNNLLLFIFMCVGHVGEGVIYPT